MRPFPRTTAAVAATATLLAVAAAALAPGTPAGARNPIVTQIYTADPAALVHNGTVYLYTGRDEATPSQQNFVMRQWRVFSSTDMVTWTDHGSPLSVDSFGWANADAWAAEVVEGPDGRFYWYVSINGFTDPGWMNIGVAVADSPLGPFTDAIGGPLISDSTPGSASLNIDPTTFVDDDGEVYLYWGSFWQPRMARLDDDMVTLDGPVVTPQGLTDFWEAPWLFTRDGLYYMAYASNSGPGCVTSSSFACIRYATATDPLGPWTHRGVVLGQVSSTTNHPAIVQFHDQWYMVYHTADAPGGGNFRRSVAVDKLFFHPDGTMQLVQQTAHGVDPVGTNLAPDAAASTSHVSPWETLAAANDGAIPLDSADRGDGVYGNWPEQGTQWVQYDWTSPQTIDRTAAYWFDDDQGIDLPASCQVQYRTGSGSWAAVPGQTACGVAGDQYQLVGFPPVTTTGLRLLFTSRPDFSTGLIELMAFAPLGGGPPPPPPPASFEAEAGTLAGTAATRAVGSASGGQVVGWVGDDPANYVELTGVTAPAAGPVPVTIHYVAGQSRPVTVTVNGAAATTVELPATGGWSTLGSTTLTLSLAAGANTIRLGHATTWAPDVDRIVVG